MDIVGWLKRHAGRLCMLAALVCVVAALWKPAWPLTRTVWHYTFIFDITQSMNTRDQSVGGQLQDRLGAARQSVQYALEHLPCGSTMGLGLYTSNNTYQLFTPLEVCEHYSIISRVLQRIDWRMAWENNSAIQHGLYAGIYLLTANANPSPPRLIFMSDGDQSPKSDREPAFMGQAGVPGGMLVGVGSETPAPVPHVGEDGSIKGYWTQAEALGQNTNDPLRTQLYLSRLDEANLKQLAAKTGMDYYRLQEPKALTAALQQKAFGQERGVETDLRWVLAGLGLVFLVLGVVVRPESGRALK